MRAPVGPPGRCPLPEPPPRSFRRRIRDPSGYHAAMGRQTARVRVAAPLRFLLPAQHRHGEVMVPVDAASSLSHLVESLGVPRTEVGELRVNGRTVLPAARPVVDASDYLTTASAHKDRVATGALCVLIMAIAVVGIAVAIYPVLKRHSQRLAMGYVVARTIEAVIYLASTVALLTVVTVRQTFVNAGGVDAARFQPLGDLLLAGRD